MIRNVFLVLLSIANFYALRSQDLKKDEILLAFYINLPNDAAISGISYDKVKNKIKESCYKSNFTPLFYDKNKSENFDHILINIHIDKKRYLISATKIKIIKAPLPKDTITAKGIEWNFENYGLFRNDVEKIYISLSTLIEQILKNIRNGKIKP